MQAQIKWSDNVSTLSTGINLNTELNKPDTMFPPMFCELKYNTEAMKSPCFKAKSSDYQSHMVSSTSLFSRARCDTLLWSILSVLHNKDDNQ